VSSTECAIHRVRILESRGSSLLSLVKRLSNRAFFGYLCARLLCFPRSLVAGICRHGRGAETRQRNSLRWARQSAEGRSYGLRRQSLIIETLRTESSTGRCAGSPARGAGPL